LRRYRARNARQGRCRDCAEKAVEGETRCKIHKEKNAEYIRESRLRQAEAAYEAKK
jgi:hypothetical protein